MIAASFRSMDATTMSNSTETARRKGSDVLREMAVHQAAAYRAYGEALERFGNGSLNSSDLFKEAGDLYYREAGRVASGLFSAYTEVYVQVLDSVGAKVLSAKDEAAGPASRSKK
jgi:hypothetical protein